MSLTLLTGVVVLVVAGLGGRLVGRAVRTSSAAYLSLSAVVVILAVAAIAVSPVLRMPTAAAEALQGIGLGLGFGGLAGLRYGYKGLFELGRGRGES